MQYHTSYTEMRHIKKKKSAVSFRDVLQHHTMLILLANKYLHWEHVVWYL